MLYALTYSGITLQIWRDGDVRAESGHIGTLRGISHHPWRSHKPEYTLEDIYASPELLTRSYLLLTQELPVWLQSKVKAGWLEPTTQDGTYIPGEFLHTMESD